MKIYFLISFFIFSILSLNAQDSVKVSGNKKATVYIIRSRTSGLHIFNFYNNNKFIGKIGGSKQLFYKCEAGKQLFWAVADNKYFLDIKLEPNEIYIIDVHKKEGVLKGNVELELVPKGSDYYNYLLDFILKHKSLQFTEDEIRDQNTLQKDFIQQSLSSREKEKKNIISTEKGIERDTLQPIVLDYPFLDYPFLNKSINLSGLKGMFTDPSMSQSINISVSLNNYKRESLFRLKEQSPFVRKNYSTIVCIADFITFLPIPLTSGWMHEEFHRAVLAKHGIGSYNDMNDLPITKTLVNVSHITDENLSRLKNESPQDMIRLSEAGIEGQYLMSNKINNEAFFSNTKSISFTPLFSNLNSLLYVLICSNKSYSDKIIDQETNSEGSDITKRDAVGLDFLSYTYDLFRPNEPYQNRGIHSSGIGINRYIKYSQLTSEEQSYLLGQGLLQFINLLNPISLMLTSYKLGTEKDGSVTRGNLYFNHWLTSFGYDISTTGLLQYHTNNFAFTLHNYVNKNQWMPGIELETFDYLLGKNVIKVPIPVTARIMAWLQPQNQLFFSPKSQLGGLIEAKIQYPLLKSIYPYISVTAKTNGWVAGNVYLESNISGSLGLRVNL